MEQMNKTVLQAITGSRAYGLEHENSDTDRMGIFVAPTTSIAGLNWASKDESWSDAGPEGDDNTKHEIGKFLRLVLKSNPTLIELLFMNEYEILDEVGQGIIDIRHKMLYEKGIRSAYLGYARAQADRVLREYPDHKPKMARHCLRISRQAIDLLTTGEFNINVGDPTEYFELTEKPFMHMGMILENAIHEIECCKSVLPESPDIKAVDDFLKEVRRNHLG
jgi:predicted nucleotidyltransferase